MPKIEEIPYWEREVRHCTCHNMYWRPQPYTKDSTMIRARGYAQRHGFSGGDYIHDFSFKREEWDALDLVSDV